NRFILDELLTSWGMRPAAVSGGVEALVELKRAAADGEPYPLILLDAMMPEMDGFTLAEQIRLHPELAGATVMMLTSADRHDDAHRCRHRGIAASLMKPIKQSELFEAVRRALGGPRGPAPDRPRPVAPSETGRRSLRVLLAEDNVVNQKFIV